MTNNRRRIKAAIAREKAYVFRKMFRAHIARRRNSAHEEISDKVVKITPVGFDRG